MPDDEQKQQTAHTPGPWHLPHFALPDDAFRGTIGAHTHKTRCNCGYVFADAQRGMGAICEIGFDGEDEPREIAVANARLIAAAPDLLAALIEAEYALDEGSRCEEVAARNKARAAIAKATGIHGGGLTT